MQYRVALLALAGFAAAQSSSSSAATASSTSGASSTETSCLAKCAAGDVDCQAQCVNVPFPNQSQVNANNECAKNCPQGDGSPDQTKAFGECLAQCASQHYYTSNGSILPGTAPTAASGSGTSASSSGSVSATPTASGSSSSATDASQATGSAGSSSSATTASPSGSSAAAQGGSSSSSSTSSSHGAAAATMIPIGMMGVAMAVLAL